MHIVRLLRWSREEFKVFKSIERWLPVHERANLTDDEVKAACRFCREPQAVNEEKLLESVAAWEKIKTVMKQQEIDAGRLAPSMPEESGGILARPQQAYELLEEIGIDCVKDIDRALELAKFGIAFLRGDLSATQLLDVRPEDGTYILQFENVEPAEQCPN